MKTRIEQNSKAEPIRWIIKRVRVTQEIKAMVVDYAKRHGIPQRDVVTMAMARGLKKWRRLGYKGRAFEKLMRREKKDQSPKTGQVEFRMTVGAA